MSYGSRYWLIILSLGLGFLTWPLHDALLGSPDQQVIWLKQRWDRLPLYVGFIFHFLQGFWYRLLVDIHLDDALQRSRTGN